jgi:HKD family nuclease
MQGLRSTACNMQFLATADSTEETITRLIRECTRLRWAVAWASHGFPAFELLREHSDKIAQLSVGTHFCQTHPRFIEAFREHPNVKFVLETNSNVFHPKVYLFEHGGDAWDCVLGSSNFTRHGLTTNSEVAVLFNCHDIDATAAKQQLDATLDEYFRIGDVFDDAALAQYRVGWQTRQHKVKPLRLRLQKQLSSVCQAARTVVENADSKVRALPDSRQNWTSADWLFEFFCQQPADPTVERLSEQLSALRAQYPHLHPLWPSSVLTYRQAWKDGSYVPVKAGKALGFARPFFCPKDPASCEKHRTRIAELRRS